MKNFRKILSMAAAVCMLMGIWTPMTARAEEGPLVVVGNVTLSGGNGNIEDVLITIKHGYMSDGPVVGTGHPDANRHYSIQTSVYSTGFLALIVTPELPGYVNYSPSSNIYPGQNSADLLLVADGTPTTFGVSGRITMNGSVLPGNLCPIVNFKVPATSGNKDIEACGGSFFCNGLAGNEVIITPRLEGYTFTPESFKIDKINRDYNDVNFVMTKIEADTEVPETPESTESTKNTVALYFMTGSSPSEPGEVFEQFEVAKNSRGNTTTLAKTIGSRVPVKDGYTFDHWKEGKLSNPSVLGNRINTVIWTNEIDQYIYAQYKKSASQETEADTDTDTAEVIVYRDSNYAGKSLALKAGKYRMSQLSKVGNDAISSIRVPEGYTVTLYADDNYKGRTLTCDSDISWLGNHKFNDITSSIVVSKRD